MKKNILNKIITSLVVIGFVLTCYYIMKKNQINDDNVIIITIVVKDLNNQELDYQEIETESGKTLINILEEHYQIVMGTGAYQGMLLGFEDIVLSAPSEGIWFIYYINGQYANQGIEEYQPLDEDYIEFVLEQY